MYDRDMLEEDFSGRFDYLFEPLEVDESAGNGDDRGICARFARHGESVRHPAVVGDTS